MTREEGRSPAPHGESFLSLTHFVILVAEPEIGLGKFGSNRLQFLLPNQRPEMSDYFLTFVQVPRPIRHGNSFSEACFPIRRVEIQSSIKKLVGLHCQDCLLANVLNGSAFLEVTMAETCCVIRHER